MNKKLLVVIVLAVLAVLLSACGPSFDVGQVVVAQQGGVDLYSSLNDLYWISTCALGTRVGENFIVEETSTYGQDQRPVYRLRSLDRTETDLLWGCKGWTSANDVDDFVPYGSSNKK